MLARIKTVAVAGCAPEVMGIGPVAASQKALQRAGLNSSDLDIVELNEAFASQALACIRELELDPKRSMFTVARSHWATRWVPPVPGLSVKPPAC